jgi:NitT/TauT family transport system permease protein
LITGLYSTPLIALAPLFILWFGVGEKKTMVLVFLLVFLPVAINTDVGVRSTDPDLIQAARSFGASRLHLFTKVRLPSSLPLMMAGMRIGLARGLIGVVVGEFFGSQEGLGYRIFNSAQYFDTSAVLGGTVLFAAAGIVLVAAMERLERWVAPWRQRDRS